jgi:hypothetical protein
MATDVKKKNKSGNLTFIANKKFINSNLKILQTEKTLKPQLVLKEDNSDFYRFLKI